MRTLLIRTGTAGAVLALVWSTPALAQRHRGGGGSRPRTVVVTGVGVGAWSPAWWGPSFYWGSPLWWGAWGPSPWGFWPYVDPAYVRSQLTSAVRVQVRPPETEVFVDGYFAGTADQFDGMFQRLRVAPGQHVLELYLAGHQSVRQDLLLAPGDSYKVQYTMQPLAAGEAEPSRPQPLTPPAAPASAPPQGLPTGSPTGQISATPVPGSPEGFGQLVVRTQPGDAEILIDGEVWHGGDALTVNLTLGSHRVEVRKEGFTSYTTTVAITPGRPVSLNVSLLQDERFDAVEVVR